MNNKNRLIGALVVSACASASFAGFIVTATLTHTGTFDRWDIVAINTGGDTGTQIKGLEYFYSGAPVAFQVDDTADPSGGDPDGIPDTVNLLSTSRTRIRVSATGANNVFVGVSPTNGFAQPNPYAAGVTSFQGAIANTGVTQASGAGFQIARLFLPTGGSAMFSGNLGGDIGSKVPFSVGGDPFPRPPVLTPASQTVNVVFGSIVSGGAPFSATVTVTDPDANDSLLLSVGAISSVRDIAVIGAAGPSPRTFTVTGIVDYSANGTDVVLPIIASDGTGQTANGSITLRVTPEPVSLGALSLVLLGGRQRRS